jgi:hypothetical protein
VKKGGGDKAQVNFFVALAQIGRADGLRLRV